MTTTPHTPPARPEDDSTHHSYDEFGRVILTVGVLRALLAGVEDDRHVVIATEDWYVNVEAVGVPNDEVWTCLTLFPGDAFDARQF